ncbi:GreA/GreB family elongation factor [Leeuwenhoekiella polynyae]|uniref:Transcription elongation factor GreB n=1 Tax=Leeuwenhoekiella polynyae TaxID=1550906 RepID=A0A4Q0P348_9FLAO|nr:GreA/GreB family elongation factor [Leeuwenhoekiella polynyae]RXG20937.1 transcription elongation factor GreB [Leeuwenhoekiella polynyae]
MSRGFVKEDDQEETPIIPPRAALPAGVVNYVTPDGFKELKGEKESLELRIASLDEPNEREHRRALAVLNGKLNLLVDRIHSARILSNVQTEEVRFGAKVTYTVDGDSNLKTITIVGVDEADVKKQKIAFTAPIAKVLIGKETGETAEINLGGNLKHLKIHSVEYTT